MSLGCAMSRLNATLCHQKKWVGKRRSGFPCIECCPHDPDSDKCEKKIDRLMNGWMLKKLHYSTFIIIHPKRDYCQFSLHLSSNSLDIFTQKLVLKEKKKPLLCGNHDKQINNAFFRGLPVTTKIHACNCMLCCNCYF